MAEHVLTGATLAERIEAEDKRWAEASEQMKQQYQLEYGAHLGRMALLKELLEVHEQETVSNE